MSLAGSMASVQVLLADGNSPADVDPTTGHGPEWGKAAPVGLLIVVLLCVAVYFLVKSMNRNLRKVPESFDPAPKVTVGANDDGSPADARAKAVVPPPAAPPPPAAEPPATGGRPAE